MEYRIDNVHNNSPVLKVMQNQYERVPIEAMKKRVEQELGAKKDFEPQTFPITKEELEPVLEDTNRIIFGSDNHFQFRVHERTNRIMVKLIDNETNEIIKEFPPEKILDMMANLWELVGILVDERA